MNKGKIKNILLVLLVFIFLSGCRSNRSLPKTGQVIIGDQIIRVEISRNSEVWKRGLSGRHNLEPNQGMLFVFSKPGFYQFWMRGMKFPLDIIWIQNGQIVGFVENASPSENGEFFVFQPPIPVQYVLEVVAGSVKSYSWKIGDEVKFIFDN